MGRNLNMILERGEKFDGLLSKSEGLAIDAKVFKKKAHITKTIMQRRYFFWYAVLLAVMTLLLYITVVTTCGLRLEYCRVSHTSSGSSSTSSGGSSSGGSYGGG